MSGYFCVSPKLLIGHGEISSLAQNRLALLFIMCRRFLSPDNADGTQVDANGNRRPLPYYIHYNSQLHDLWPCDNRFQNTLGSTSNPPYATIF